MAEDAASDREWRASALSRLRFGVAELAYFASELRPVSLIPAISRHRGCRRVGPTSITSGRFRCHDVAVDTAGGSGIVSTVGLLLEDSAEGRLVHLDRSLLRVLAIVALSYRQHWH